jgi:hypothetical protein
MELLGQGDELPSLIPVQQRVEPDDSHHDCIRPIATDDFEQILVPLARFTQKRIGAEVEGKGDDGAKSDCN